MNTCTVTTHMSTSTSTTTRYACGHRRRTLWAHVEQAAQALQAATGQAVRVTRRYKNVTVCAVEVEQAHGQCKRLQFCSFSNALDYLQSAAQTAQAEQAAQAAAEAAQAAEARAERAEVEAAEAQNRAGAADLHELRALCAELRIMGQLVASALDRVTAQLQ